MGKLNIFTITLSNPGRVYYSGTAVEGYVTVELNEPMQMRAVRVAIKGAASVRWTEHRTRSVGSGKDRRTEHYTVTYTGSETYLETLFFVFGDGNQKLMHPVGRFTYPFKAQLPPLIPCSFQGAHGNVSYYVKATIDKPWKFDHNCKQPFTVICPYNLNLNSLALQPGTSTGSKTICCCCCESGPITATIRTDRSGFVPGENIVVSGSIENLSSRRVTSSKITLMQVVTFIARHSHGGPGGFGGKSRRSMQALTRIVRGPLEENETDSFNGVLVHVPPVAPSELRYCNIIHVEYHLEFSVHFSGVALALNVAPVPVVIGTIPLESTWSAMMAQPTAPPVTQQPLGFETMGALPPEYHAPNPSAPPPTYAECVFGKQDLREDGDNEHMRGETNFAPAYTYYNWGDRPTFSLPPPEESK